MATAGIFTFITNYGKQDRYVYPSRKDCSFTPTSSELHANTELLNVTSNVHTTEQAPVNPQLLTSNAQPHEGHA
jgi:hypothetical protein